MLGHSHHARHTHHHRRPTRIALLVLAACTFASLTLVGQAAHWHPHSAPLAESLPPVAARAAEAATPQAPQTTTPAATTPSPAPAAPAAAARVEKAAAEPKPAANPRPKAASKPKPRPKPATEPRAAAKKAKPARKAKAATRPARKQSPQRAAARVSRQIRPATTQKQRAAARKAAARQVAQRAAARRAAQRAAAVRAEAARRAALVKAAQAAAAQRAEEVRLAAASRHDAAPAMQAEVRQAPFPVGGWVKALVLQPVPGPATTSSVPDPARAAARTAAEARKAEAARKAAAARTADVARKAAAARKAEAARTAAAARAAQQKAAQQKAAAALAAKLRTRSAPGPVATSHYLRSLNGHAGEGARMRALGFRDARRHPSGHTHLVLLDIGGQTSTGVRLSATTGHVTYRQLADAVKAYADGYARGQRRLAPVEIAIGTNNDMLVNFRSGRLWADLVVDPVQAHVRAKRYPAMMIEGANDIEPGFAAGPRAVRDWVKGYLAATSAPLVNNGSADGCVPTRRRAMCNRGWSMTDLAWVSGMAAPGRITVLPQIYNRTMAAQWAQIGRTAATYGQRLEVLGPLTESAACRGVPACPTMHNGTAWLELWRNLNRHPETRTATLPMQTDLDVR